MDKVKIVKDYDILQSMRKNGNTDVVIFMNKDSKLGIKALNTYADDWVVPNISNVELQLRIDNVAHRHKEDSFILQYKDIKFNKNHFDICEESKWIHFTKTQGKALTIIFERLVKNRVVTREYLCSKLDMDANRIHGLMKQINDRLQVYNFTGGYQRPLDFYFKKSLTKKESKR